MLDERIALQSNNRRRTRGNDSLDQKGEGQATSRLEGCADDEVIERANVVPIPSPARNAPCKEASTR